MAFIQAAATSRPAVVAAAAGVPSQRRPRASRARVVAPAAAAPAAPAAATSPSTVIEEGADVVGTVVWAGPKGAKVLLPDDSVGFMPSREGPYTIRDPADEKTPNQNKDGPCVPKGLTRTFKVINMPGTDKSGKPQTGPLLSARLCDLDVLWQRASQLSHLSSQYKENLRVTVEGANSGGLVSRLNGLSLFVPVSQLEKRSNNQWWTEEDMNAHFSGKEVSLAVLEVARSTRKVVCSLVKARENDELRQLEVGTLVTGTVRRVEPFGVFVGINGTRVSGLLHISNVSREHVETVQGVFKPGEEVKCLVMGLDPSYTNISLSVAELELEDGDVLRNKQRVWDSAEEQAALFRAHLDELRAEGFDFDAEYEQQGPGGNSS